MMRFAPIFSTVALVLGFGLGFGLAALTPARADYAVVRFADGNCQIWSNAGDTPWGTNWSKIAITPNWAMAQAALNDAIQDGACY